MAAVIALCYFQRFDAAGLVTGMTAAGKKYLCHFCNGSVPEQMEKDNCEEPGNQGPNLQNILR